MSAEADGATGGREQPIDPNAIPSGAWSVEIRVGFGQCDAAGIAFTPRYFDLFIEAIERWYEEELGFSLRNLVLERKVGLGYAEAGGVFFLPSTVGDRLTITPVVEHIGTSSFRVVVHVVADGRERARGRMVSVSTCLAKGDVIPLPMDVREGLERHRDSLRKASD